MLNAKLFSPETSWSKLCQVYTMTVLNYNIHELLRGNQKEHYISVVPLLRGKVWLVFSIDIMGEREDIEDEVF